MIAIPTPSNLSTPIAIDLFSGCGGLTLGLKQAGFRVIAAVEIDELAAETYQLNHAEVRIYQNDIRDLHPRSLKRQLRLGTGQLDLLAGCPPCQGFSQMRTLNGARKIFDKNNDLLFRFLLFVREFRPKAIMLENVPDLAKDERMDDFRKVLGMWGYDSGEEIIQVLNAASYGVPQRRRRMILISGRKGPIGFAEQVPNRVLVKDVLENLPAPGDSGDPLHDSVMKHSPAVLERIKLIPKDGGGRLDLSPESQLPCHQKTTGFKDVYGRMAWNDVAPTITGGCVNPSKGRFLHPDQDRAISLREAALLQSFPPAYKFSLRRGRLAAAVMIGNALPPEFIRQHAMQIKGYLESSYAVPSLIPFPDIL